MLRILHEYGKVPRFGGKGIQDYIVWLRMIKVLSNVCALAGFKFAGHV
jgi:hypothetical protein